MTLKQILASRGHVTGADMDAVARRLLYDAATQMHGSVRRRTKLFSAAVLDDNAMALMLSLFIAEIDAIPVSEASLLFANEISLDEGGKLIGKLVQAGLATVTAEMAGQRTVGLTPIGSARMRSHVVESTQND